MRKVNEYVEMLKKETTQKIKEQIKSDAGAYKNLMKDLLVQVSQLFYSHFILIGVGFDQINGGYCDHQMQRKRQENS